MLYKKIKTLYFLKRSVITMDFSNKSVVITGAGNGIGRGIALHYAEKGANVILADIDEKAGTKTVVVSCITILFADYIITELML